MKRIITAGLAAAGALALAAAPSVSAQEPASAQEPGGTCVECHGMLDSEPLKAPVEHYAADVHAAEGFGCADCHGGDPTIAGFGAMDPAAGYVGAPSGEEVIEVCGRCHSDAEFMHNYDPSLRVDQVTEYLTSRHGQLLAADGDTSVATCVDCHPAHDIRPPSDPRSSVYPANVASTCGRCHADPDRMAPYDIPTDQLDKYHESVHWQAMSEKGDMSAPTCNDCHGNHGAAPPGVAWVGNVCGQCHVVQAERFAASRHSEVLAMLGDPGCATCHSNHAIHEASDAMLGLGENAVCAGCHGEGDPGGQAAASMRTSIDSLTGRIDTAAALLHHAEQEGMEVSASEVDLQDARTALVKSRAAIHSFAPDSVRAEVAPGLEIASKVFERGQAALADLRVRRLGLVGSVILILVLIAGLVLKIRDIERRSTDRPERA